jgi:ribosomal protein S18 acetylase RimI-like enzyme
VRVFIPLYFLQTRKDISMNFVGKALARRLESAEEMPQVHYAKLYQKVRPEIGAAVEEFCGGHMIFAGLNSPMGRTVTAADLDRMEEFYYSHKAPAQIDVCPLTDASLLELLKQRGYTMAELNNVLFRRLDKGDASAGEETFAEIRVGRADEAEEFARILRLCFFPGGDGPPEFVSMLAPMFQFEGVMLFAAEVDGKPIACAEGMVIPEHKVVALFGAGTLPEFRRRGIQTALLCRRMAAAAEAGCEYAVIVTNGGSTSQHNAERLGFRLAYSKATMLKAFRPG